MQLFPRKKSSPRHINDVFFDPKRQTLDLREKTWKLELSRNKVLGFFRHHVWMSLASLILFVGLVVLIWGKPSQTKADTIVFYPSSCLGGWKNPDHAAGKPEGESGKRDDDFTNQNSSVLSNSSSQIFCGSFKGEIPPATTPQKIILSFYWRLKAVEDPIPAPAVITDENANSTLEVILDTPSTTPTSITNEVPPAPEPVPESSPETPIDPVSFFRTFIPVAYAEEVATTTPTSTPEVLPASDEFLEVLYTLDGSEWVSLGKIKAADLSAARFEIPASAYSRWTDLAKLQMQIRSLPTFDNPGALYLDGMVLEVSYGEVDKIQEAYEDQNKPHIKGDDATTTPLRITAGLDQNNIEILKISSDSDTLGGIDVYNAVTDTLVLTANPDQTSSYEVSVLYFTPGVYTLLRRDSQTSCNNLSLKACRFQEGFKDETMFQIIAPVASSTPEDMNP
ncbi:MAG: hypothetical protein JWN89_89 [Parcubacteria group bacterium]|nr:hypothetical protein [Parcubacteria group bacterium]